MKKIILLAIVLGSGFGASAQYRVNAGASVGAGASMFSLGVERELTCLAISFISTQVFV